MLRGPELLFSLGVLCGALLDVVLFWWRLIAPGPRGALARAEVRALDAIGGPLAGAALVRLDADGRATAMRLQRPADPGNPRAGDQDVVFGAGTPWRIDGHGIVQVRAVAVGDAITLEAGGRAIAEVRVLDRVDADPRALRISLFRTGRGFTPTGFRNGIRAAVYPVVGLARRLRGG